MQKNRTARALATAVVTAGLMAAGGGALAAHHENPCAAKAKHPCAPMSPCAAKNPCAAKH